MPLPVQVFNLQQPASSVSGSGGAESQDRMRDSSAPSSASSSVTDLYCTPHSSRSDLVLPGTAGDFSLSASLSAWGRGAHADRRGPPGRPAECTR
ncbi:GPS1 isoform 16, partial [Pongo abelii]